MNKRQSLNILGNFLKSLLFLAIISALVGLSLSCKKETPSPSPTVSESATPEPAVDNLTNLDTGSVLSEIETNYSTARQKAAQWKADAVLYSVSAKITSSLEWEDVIEVYTFGSASDPANWWTISISVRSKNYVRAVIPKEDYLGSSLKPAQTAYWKVSYVEAFQIAEKNGGKEWRDKLNNSNYMVTTTLAHGEPKGYLYWMVEYQNSDGSDKKTVQINSNNGEVVTQES